MSKPIILFPEEIALVRKLVEHCEKCDVEYVRGRFNANEDTIDKLVRLGFINESS